MTTKLEQAARQALEALKDYHKADDDRVSVAMSILQEALAETQVDWKEEAMRLAGLNAKHVGELRKLEAEQAEQSQLADATLEPVAWFVQYKNRHEFVFGNKTEFIVDGVVEPLYAAPVRTKDPCNPLQDLTDDEIRAIWLKVIDPDGGDEVMALARAVIAAYKEKNK